MPGTLTISIEIELGWGVHDLSTRRHLSEGGRREREYLGRLLRKADDCGVPISFDIVGHLLLAECDGAHEGPYPEGWFDADPGTDVETDGLFYGPDLARAVLDADVDHELCTHTFSHLLLHQASDDLLTSELERVRELHADVDGDVVSIVPPRHYRPNNEVLRRNGIRVARYARTKESPTLAHRLKQVTVGPHPQWNLHVNDGVLETYCTTYPSLIAGTLRSGREPPRAQFRHLPLAARKRAHRFYLERATNRAIESEVPLHLWCHLYDLSNEEQWSVLGSYLEFLGDLPDEELEVLTMESLADRHLEDWPANRSVRSS